MDTNQSTTQQLDPQVVNLTKAIRHEESGGNFNATSPAGAYGAYQFLPSMWDSTSKKYGVNVSLHQATPEQQTEVAYKQIADWKKQGHNVGQIASMWIAGPGKPDDYLDQSFKGTKMNPATGKSWTYDVSDYAKKVATTYQHFKSGGQAGKDINNSSSTTSTDNQTPKPSNPYGASNPAGNESLFSGQGLLKTAENIPSSAWNLVKNLGNVIMHPQATLQNIGDAISGGVEKGMDATGITKALGGQIMDTPEKQKASQVWNGLKDRYGSLDNIRKTIENDPTGFAMDVATLATGGGELIKGAGLINKATEIGGLTEGLNAADKASMINEASRTGELGKVAQVGQKVSDVANAANPVNLGVKGIGKVMGLTGQGLIKAKDVIDWANTHGMAGVSYARATTALATHLLGVGFEPDMIMTAFEPVVAKVIDAVIPKVSKGLIGAGKVISKVAPKAGVLGTKLNVAGKVN